MLVLLCVYVCFHESFVVLFFVLAAYVVDSIGECCGAFLACGESVVHG